MNFDNNKIAFLLQNPEVTNEIYNINENDPEGTYSEAASNLYVSLAALNLLELTINEAQSHIELQDKIETHLSTHELDEQLALSSAVWYMIFQLKLKVGI